MKVDTVVNWLGSAVSQNASYAADLLILMTACFALTAHFGELIEKIGIVVLISADAMAVYTVARHIDAKTAGPIDVVVFVICLGLSIWAGRNRGVNDDKTSNGFTSPQFD